MTNKNHFIQNRPIAAIGFMLAFAAMTAGACEVCGGDYDGPNVQITEASARYDSTIDSLILEMSVEGEAGATAPVPAGQLDGAPVLGYVFPTTLKATDVGFSEAEGIVALALTSHPDFDDTPLWDENLDRDYDNDGVVWHPHWVVLVEDDRVEGGLAVKQFEKGDESVTLPPTAPGMPMFMDSPGFTVVTSGDTIRVIVPADRLNRQKAFKFDAVAAFMRVNTSDKALPMLGVYKVYSVGSGDLSLPYTVKE